MGVAEERAKKLAAKKVRGSLVDEQISGGANATSSQKPETRSNAPEAPKEAEGGRARRRGSVYGQSSTLGTTSTSSRLDTTSQSLSLAHTEVPRSLPRGRSKEPPLELPEIFLGIQPCNNSWNAWNIIPGHVMPCYLVQS
eukprot:symbB.v1.2.001612.t1/scaffold89.1/size472826/16